MTELSLKTKHRLNMNLYKDKVWVTVKKIFFPVTILAEDLCYAKNLIFSSIRIEQWDPKLFNDKFSVYIRNGVHCCVLSRLTKDDLRWLYEDMKVKSGEYIINDVYENEPVAYVLSNWQKKRMIGKLKKLI